MMGLRIALFFGIRYVPCTAQQGHVPALHDAPPVALSYGIRSGPADKCRTVLRYHRGDQGALPAWGSGAQSIWSILSEMREAGLSPLEDDIANFCLALENPQAAPIHLAVTAVREAQEAGEPLTNYLYRSLMRVCALRRRYDVGQVRAVPCGTIYVRACEPLPLPLRPYFLWFRVWLNVAPARCV